jgi:hypothetical protein
VSCSGVELGFSWVKCDIFLKVPLETLDDLVEDEEQNLGDTEKE